MFFIMKMELTQRKSDISSYADECFVLNIHIFNCVLFDCQTCLLMCKSINNVILRDEIYNFIFF